MAKIDLYSRDWCDIIFEGKNKQYGAYVMRAETGKRNGKAMLAVIIILLAAIFIPALVKTVMPKQEIETVTTTQLSKLEEAKVKDKHIIKKVEPKQQEPQRIKSSIKFTAPKIVRDEDSYVTKSYFKSLKENFKQASILQVIQFTAGGILLLDFLLMKDKTGIYRYLVIAIALILYMVSLYIFPLLSKFVNTVTGTLKNAALMSILALPKTVLMVLVSAVPLVIIYFFDLKAIPILILFGIAGPGFVHALLYNGTFKRFEPKEETVTEEEELEAAIRKIDETKPSDESSEQ